MTSRPTGRQRPLADRKARQPGEGTRLPRDKGSPERQRCPPPPARSRRREKPIAWRRERARKDLDDLRAPTRAVGQSRQPCRAGNRRWPNPGVACLPSISRCGRRCLPLDDPYPPIGAACGSTGITSSGAQIRMLWCSWHTVGGQIARRLMPDASQRLVTWWRGVLAGPDRPGPEVRVAQESAHEPGQSADAAPVVVPQRRHQP